MNLLTLLGTLASIVVTEKSEVYNDILLPVSSIHVGSTNDIQS